MEPGKENVILEKLEEINQKVDGLGDRVNKLEASTPQSVITSDENSKPAPAALPEVESAPKAALATPVAETPVTIFEPKTKVFKEKQNIEMRLGQYWFPRIGIVALVIGFALFLIYALQYFGPAGKIGIGFFASVILMGLGTFLERKDSKLGTYAQILFGGGVALAYFTSYAMYFFGSSKVIDSQVADLIILSVISISYLLYSLRYKKEVLSIIAFMLAVLTMNLGAVANFSLLAILIFTAVSVFIATKYRWKGLLMTTALATYFTQFHWIFSGTPDTRTILGMSLSLLLVSALLTIYYIAFNVSAAWFDPESEGGPRAFYVLLTMLNSAFYFLIIGLLFSQSYKNIWATVMFVAAATQLGTFVITHYLLGWVKSSLAWYILGFLSLGIALLIQFHSFELTISWLVIATAMMLSGFVADSARFRITGLIFSLLALLSLIGSYFTPGYPYGLISAIFAVVMMGFSAFYVYKPQESVNEKSAQSLFSVMSLSVVAVGLMKIIGTNNLVIAWSLVALGFILVSFWLKDRPLRYTGLGLLVITFLALIGSYGTIGYPFGLAALVLAVVLMALSLAYFFLPQPEDSKEKSLQSFYSVSALVVTAICLMKIAGSNFLTLEWGLAGLGFAMFGFVVKDRPLRLAGFGLLLLTILKLFLVDSAGLEPLFKIVSFMVLGVILLLISYGYTKYKDVIKRYL